MSLHKKDSVFKSICTYRVFGALEGNRAIYFDTVSSIIESVVSGFNATIFAYGQEGLCKQLIINKCTLQDCTNTEILTYCINLQYTPLVR